MKNALLKFAGLFVEKVPVDAQGNPLPKQLRPNASGPAVAQPAQPQHAAPPPINTVQPGVVPPQPGMPSSPSAPAPPPSAGGMPLHGAAPAHPDMQPTGALPGEIPGMAATATPPSGAPTIAVALRAWVPQEYAAHLAPFGLHVIAAGGSVTSEQARAWGADVLIVSAECLGQDLHLLQQPQIATVFITPQPVMIPDVPGVLQVQEPLRASDVSQAAREAISTFALQ